MALYAGSQRVSPTTRVPISNQDKTITENGTYTADSGYTGLGTVTVNVSDIGITRAVENGVYSMPTTDFTFSLPDGVTDIDLYVMAYAFYGCTTLTGVDLSSLTSLSKHYALQYAFMNCTNLSGTLDLSNLVTISGSGALQWGFYNCELLTALDFSNLTTVSSTGGMQNAFVSCTGLTHVTFPKLSTVSGSKCLSHTFNDCTSMEALSFPALTSNSFGIYTNQFNNMLYGVSDTVIHFPSNLESVIGSWSDVTAGFGGTDTTVLFDLEATT